MSCAACVGRVEKVTMVFVPIVMGVAMLTFLIWLTFGPEPALTFALVDAVERRSEHPIAEAIVAAARAAGLERADAEGFEATAGHGVRATVAGRVSRSVPTG